MRKLQPINLLLILLAALGLAMAAYSFLHNQDLASGSFCDINDTFNCDIVNKGPYGKIAGIPVSLIGMIGYAFMLLAAGMKARQPEDRSLTTFLLLSTGAGLAFSLYLTGIEAFVLRAYCVVCLSSQATILALFALTLKLWYTEKERGTNMEQKA